MTIVLWLLALLCFFLVLTCAVWLSATPVEESTIVTDSTGEVIESDSETDLTPMIVPAVFFVASLVCLIASVVGLIKVRQKTPRVT